MQSIYGFREAEVRAFLELAEEGIGEVQFDVERLRSNFRSGKPLVEWINDCFARILPRTDDRDRGAIAFRPSESARPTDAASMWGLGCEDFRAARRRPMPSPSLIARESERHPEWRIVFWCAHGRMPATLRRACVPDPYGFGRWTSSRCKDRPVVRDLVMLIGSLLHLGDRTAWLALLRAPWVGLTLTIFCAWPVRAL
jgi:hypothetical protein